MLNQTWFRSLLVVLLGLSVYSFVLSAPFKFWDDQISILNNPLIRSPHHLKEIFTRGYFNDHTFYRPMVYVSYMAEYLAVGLNAFLFNLDNIFLHIINALLVWVLIRLMTGSSSLGFWTGLLFVLHPIHAEAVGNISGRAIILSACFVLSSFILFLLYEQKNDKRFLFLSLGAFLLALLSKESSAVLPGVIFMYLWLKKKPVLKIWPFAVVIAGYLGWRHHLHMTQMLPYNHLQEYILGFVTFLRSLLTDFRELVFPLNLYFDRSQPMFLSTHEGGFWLTIITWLILAGILIKNRARLNTLDWFVLSWFALEMFPVSQLVTTIGVGPSVISCADHFLYLSSIPLLLIIVKQARRWSEKNQHNHWIDPKIVHFLLGVFCLFLFLMTVEQNIYARNELSMLEHSAKMQPKNARVQSGIGIIYAYNSKYAEAQPYFIRAVGLDPFNTRYQISLAQSECDLGHYKQCLALYEHIENAGPLSQLLEKNKEAAKNLVKTHE